ncbi:hypothetical protein G5C60_44945 [Streptomyces sp. HC44]|uniref:Lipoprotein n=1 Tax=Streptomyces scabichelini TaxID=2711217 RepID=A0A6G4VK58_9ACTN|nr:hypothetical protein [Streptomyces scabichelini]NGO14558.1 hypothetical protein [Streptomyces scabichelini]
MNTTDVRHVPRRQDPALVPDRGVLTPRRARRILAAFALAATATLLVAGCSDSSAAEDRDKGKRESAASAQPAGPRTSPEPSAEPATLEELAKAVGCTKPKEAGKTLDYRQGVCEADGADYVLLTFDTARGQRDWLDVSQLYGGVYLVGNRWALSASPRSAMESARDRLGGTIEDSKAYDASPSAS